MKLIEQGTDLEQVIPYVKLASEAFEEARKLGPDNTYGYISEVQMLQESLTMRKALPRRITGVLVVADGRHFSAR